MNSKSEHDADVVVYTLTPEYMLDLIREFEKSTFQTFIKEYRITQARLFGGMKCSIWLEPLSQVRCTIRFSNKKNDTKESSLIFQRIGKETLQPIYQHSETKPNNSSE